MIEQDALKIPNININEKYYDLILYICVLYPLFPNKLKQGNYSFFSSLGRFS